MGNIFAHLSFSMRFKQVFLPLYLYMSGFYKNIGQEYVKYDFRKPLIEGVSYKHELKGYGPEFDKTYIFEVTTGYNCCEVCVFYNLCTNFPWDIVGRKKPDPEYTLPYCHGSERFTLPKI